jgi:hypothetical protein
MANNYPQLVITRDEAERKLHSLRETFEVRPHAFTESHKRLAIARAEQWLRICQSVVAEYEAAVAAQADADAAREENAK